MATQYGMLIDTKRCIACSTCAVACKVANNLADDMWWDTVINVGGTERDSPTGTYPNLTMSSYTFSCQHCAQPKCIAVCPADATYKDPDTGIVMQDSSKCIGCKLCIQACPYTGVRTFQDGDPKFHTDFAVGDPDCTDHVANTVEKCTFCAHRVARNATPACVEVCPARARTFGDLNDPTSDIAKKLASRSSKQLKPEEGTNPSVYLLL
jgi:molybdopterin-containing oxidoreductase family iron-sulfur binding subunit